MASIGKCREERIIGNLVLEQSRWRIKISSETFKIEETDVDQVAQ